MKKVGRFCLLVFIFFGSSVSYGASVSEASVFQWSHIDFCNVTVPSYVDAYSDGDKELILMFLAKNERFKGLSETQQKAFLRILDYYHGRHSGTEKLSLDEIRYHCAENLEKAITSVSYEKHMFCSDISDSAMRLLDKEHLEKNNIFKIKSMTYHECMKKQ